MSTKLITHADLDGAGCAVMVKKFLDPDADITYLDYDRIDEEVRRFIKDPTHKHLILSDISPTFDVFEELGAARGAGAFTCLLVDHHKSRSWLGAVPAGWIAFDMTVSATELMAKVGIASPEYTKLAQVVTAYDLWQKQSPLRVESESLNDLFFFLGRDEFLSMACDDPQFYKTARFHYISDALAAQRERTVVGVVKKQLGDDPHVYTSREGHNTYLMVVASRFTSEIGNCILTDYPHIGFAAIVNAQFNKVELRARVGEVDVSKIAAARGGGGHQAASGFPFPFANLLSAAADGIL